MSQIETAPPADSQLPSPAELPEADIVIYDGHCVFCRGQVNRLHRFDGRGRLAFLSLHSPEVAERFPDLTHEQLMEEMVVVTASEQRHGGASAIRYLSRRLPLLWPLMPLLHIPGSLFIWRWLYAKVAKWRYKIQGKTCDSDSCPIHYR